jgi:hypothetical protein
MSHLLFISLGSFTFCQSIKSIILEEYPISLSYHPTTFTILSITDVSVRQIRMSFYFQ